MGIVFLAKNKYNQKEFALKKVYCSTLKEMNFSLKEVLNGRIKNDNLVFYENAEQEEEIINGEKKYCLMIHMDYFDSGDLRTYLKERLTIFNEKEALGYMFQLSNGLKALHDYGIVHRGII
jgi:serine/threonine protein kinase